MRIERDVFVQLRNAGQLSEETLRELQQDLDLEEALLEGRAADLDPDVELGTAGPVEPPPNCRRLTGGPGSADRVSARGAHRVSDREHSRT